MTHSEHSPVGELVDDLSPVMPYVGQWLIRYCVDIGVHLIHPIRQFLAGQQTRPVSQLIANLFKILFGYPLQLILTVCSLLLNALASLINNTVVNSRERMLSIDEVAYLRPVFANSVDYQLVRLQFGGVKEALRISPQAVGNDIFIRQKWGSRAVYPDGTLTNAGLRLLGHEVAHVWQYQNTGAGYIGDSLITQTLDFIGRIIGLRLSEGYDVRSAIKHQRFVGECNVEQQAVMAELIGAACHAEKNDELSLDIFATACGFTISADEYAVVRQTRDWFMNAGVEQPSNLKK